MEKYIFRNCEKERIIYADNTTDAKLKFASGKVEDYYGWKLVGVE